MTIATTIRDQIGPGALMMLGAYDLLDCGDALQFKFKGSRRCNVVQIQLAADDTYTVRFSKWQRAKLLNTPTGEYDGLYADQLHALIERVTGLYTRL